MMKVFGDYFIVKPDEHPGVERGLYLPERTRDEFTEAGMIGTVVAKGTGRRVESFKLDEEGNVHRIIKRIPMDEIQVGDRVVFPRWAGMVWEDEKEGRLLFLRYDQILAVIDP